MSGQYSNTHLVEYLSLGGVSRRGMNSQRKIINMHQSAYYGLTGVLISCIFAGLGFCSDKTPDCQPESRIGVDDKSDINYTGSLRTSAPIYRKGCESSEGLFVAHYDTPSGHETSRYLDLPFAVDKKEDSSKLEGLLFPIDMVIEEHQGENEVGPYGPYYLITVILRQKAKEVIKDKGTLWYFLHSKEPMRIIADGQELSFYWKGRHGSLTLLYQLFKEDIIILSKAKSCVFLLAYNRDTRWTTKPIETVTIKGSLTNEGVKNLHKFIKVVEKTVPAAPTQPDK